VYVCVCLDSHIWMGMAGQVPCLDNNNHTIVKHVVYELEQCAANTLKDCKATVQWQGHAWSCAICDADNTFQIVD